jgi:integrase
MKDRVEAEREARKLRTLIEEGQFGDVPTAERITLKQLLEAYVKDYVTPERSRSLTNTNYQVESINRTVVELPTAEQRAFGDWLAIDVNTAALERFRSARRGQSIIKVKDADGRERSRRVGGMLTTNRNLALLRAAFNWAIRVGHLETTPFKRNTETVVKLSQETSRRRRLEADESERLLNACDPLRFNPLTKQPMPVQPPARLRPIVEAALETGCRSGELLSLQWRQIRNLDGPRPELVLPAGKTKTAHERVVPISGRLKAILEMRRNDPNGEPHGPQAYVFGNETGLRTVSVRTAWKLACRRAGIEDLHFHDLRREAGSRWLEGGVPLQTVRDWLGHANISQTSTYLESTLKGQHEAMRRFEEAREVACNARANSGAKPPSESFGDSPAPETNSRDRSDISRSAVN